MTQVSQHTLNSAESSELLASGFGAVEGPTVDDDGNLYFCDLFKGGVFRLAADGTQQEVFLKRRYIGGLCLHTDGGIIMSGRDVSHLRNGEMRILLDRDDVPGAGPYGGIWRHTCRRYRPTVRWYGSARVGRSRYFRRTRNANPSQRGYHPARRRCPQQRDRRCGGRRLSFDGGFTAQ